jgi:5-formyltetrahydrofolate cyclo-ligase
LNEAFPSKPALRAAALSRRDTLPPEARLEGSGALARHALPLIERFRPRCIAGYVAMLTEVDPAPLLEAARAAGATTVLPVTMKDGPLVFRRYAPGDRLVPAGFGTTVPHADAPRADPDFIVVPLAAFDRRGFRIGYGKGHYDRTIAALRARGLDPPLLGVAFAVQEVDRVPDEPHDVRLDFVATEAGLVDFRTRD